MSKFFVIACLFVLSADALQCAVNPSGMKGFCKADADSCCNHNGANGAFQFQECFNSNTQVCCKGTVCPSGTCDASGAIGKCTYIGGRSLRSESSQLSTNSPEKTSTQYHAFAESHKADLATFNAAHSKEEIASVNKMIKEAMSRGVEFEKIAQRIEALLAQTSYQQKMKAFVESHKDDLETFNAAHSKEQLADMDHMVKEAMSHGVEFEKIEQRIEALISAYKQKTATADVSKNGKTITIDGNNLDLTLGRSLRGTGRASRNQLA
jgi:adenylosuccinate synthase